MKTRIITAVIAMATCLACNNEEPLTTSGVASCHFNLKGDFSSPTFTRLSADGADITDVWLFDYMNGSMQQAVHIEGQDNIQATLAIGHHNLYFVASRGTDPAVDNAEHTITWDSVRDTFWQTIDIDVTSNDSEITRSVTLDRVVTKLRIVVSDVVPQELASITICPDTWYSGIDYISGTPTALSDKEISIPVPPSYHGTKGNLSLTAFSFSGNEEWKAGIDIEAISEKGDIISTVHIPQAPFLQNRVTQYTGNLFSSQSAMTIALNTQWLDPYNATW